MNRIDITDTIQKLAETESAHYTAQFIAAILMASIAAAAARRNDQALMEITKEVSAHLSVMLEALLDGDAAETRRAIVSAFEMAEGVFRVNAL